MNKATSTSPNNRKARARFYRLCRIWHGYLSAFAFLALLFFSVTGLLLNHPDWFAGERISESHSITLARDVLKSASAGEEPAQVLAEAIARVTEVRGAFTGGTVEDGTATIRLEGVKGTTDISVNMATGQAQVTTETADAVSVLHELHRGTLSGATWRALIDVTAVVVIVLSILGYVLFFSLRYRLRTSLLLTGISLGVLIGVFLLLVP